MTIVVASSRILTSRGRPSAPPRLPSLPQPVDTNLPSDPVRSLDISLHQNTSLHHYDQDVVRELSIPPESVNQSGPNRSQPNQSNGFPTRQQPEGPPSSYLTSPLPHNVPLEHSSTRPRTLSAPALHSNLFAQHGLPASLPPPPRTTFYTTTHIPSSESAPLPEADNLATYLDTILRGSYSNMLSKNTETSLTPNSAQELPRGAELELSLDDMLTAEYLESNNPFEEFLTSPMIQDDSPDETPYLDTPGEDAWTSPMVDGADDSFGYGEMPLFGAVVKRQERSDEVKQPESLDLFSALQLYTPAEPTALESFPSPTKVDSVTPLLDPLDMMYTMPPTPALAPGSLYNSPHMSSTLTLAPSPSPSTSTATAASSNQPRPTKPMPTGTRRNITPAALVPIDAPTQPRQYVMPSSTSRKVLPAAFSKGKKRARFEVDGDGDDADQLPEDVHLDPNTQEAIEAKRRQNTLAARRSRQRKLTHVRELEDIVQRVSQDRDMWMTRAYAAEEKLRVNGLEP